jgi:beta-mannosidase
VTGKVTWVATDVAGRTLARGAKAVEARALGNTLALTVDLARVLAKQGPRDIIVWVDLWVRGERHSSNLALFARPKHLELADPRIGVTTKDLKDGAFVVTLTARKPALWTWLELDQADAHCSDNFIHLMPGQPRSVIVTPARPLTLARLKKALRVQSLFNTYA